jgi:hypothetical protein
MENTKGKRERFAQYLVIPNRAFDSRFSGKENLFLALLYFIPGIGMPQILYAFYSTCPSYPDKQMYNVLCAAYALIAVAVCLGWPFLGIYLGWSLKMGRLARQIKKQCLHVDLEEGEKGGGRSWIGGLENYSREGKKKRKGSRSSLYGVKKLQQRNAPMCLLPKKNRTQVGIREFKVMRF